MNKKNIFAQLSTSGFGFESFSMKVARKMGCWRLRWSLRRLHCPVPKSALVLEVGAGGNPYPRANVLLDAMESSIERYEQNLITDRPLVLGLCEELPFKDKSFDFIIASHVLEHTDNPEKFLSELMRVGKAGYIETPDGWFEKMCAYTYHRLEVSANGNKLLINKKDSWKPDGIANLWDIKLANSKALSDFLRINPDLNHLRFYWKDSIDYEILNPEVNASWQYPEKEISKSKNIGKSTFFTKLRNCYLLARRWLFSQNRRNRSINFYKLIRCPSCHSESLQISKRNIFCSACSVSYSVKNNIPSLFPQNLDGFNNTRVRSQK